MSEDIPSTETVLETLSKMKIGTLSTLDSDGSPYAVPINFIVLDGAIYFHGKNQGTKVSNLSKDSRCCLTAFNLDDYEKTGEDACDIFANYESVVVKGKATSIEDPDDKMALLRVLVDTLLPARAKDAIGEKMVDVTGVFRIDVDSASIKCHVPTPGNKIYKL